MIYVFCKAHRIDVIANVPSWLIKPQASDEEEEEDEERQKKTLLKELTLHQKERKEKVLSRDAKLPIPTLHRNANGHPSECVPARSRIFPPPAVQHSFKAPGGGTG